MSMQQEQIVRDFLDQRMPSWRQMPYDWMDFRIEDLDMMGLLPIPDEVNEAYIATRVNPADRSRDEAEYGIRPTREDNLRRYLNKRAEAGEDLIPVNKHVDQMTARERKKYVLYERDLRALSEREFGLDPQSGLRSPGSPANPDEFTSLLTR
jgi:hypothetical protein